MVRSLVSAAHKIPRYAKGHDLKYQVEDGGGFNPQNIKPKSYGEKFMYKPPRKGLTD
jgi:hypothetical protein